MFSRFLTRTELRRATQLILMRGDERQLNDIGLTRAEVDAMHLGLTRTDAEVAASKFFFLPPRRTAAA